MSHQPLIGLLLATTLIGYAPMAEAQSGPPWPPGDEIGMANTLGPQTWRRCAEQLGNPRAKSYELSHVRSATMPQSPFGVKLEYRYPPTRGVHPTSRRRAGNPAGKARRWTVSAISP
jgi:hypothetical protein